MGRIRTLKPTVWDDERLNTCPIGARLLFVGLITQADDEGRLRGAPSRVRSVIFQYDTDLSDDTVTGWLELLAEARLIRRYAVEGQSYIELVGWSAHQRIDKPQPSTMPAYGNKDKPREGRKPAVTSERKQMISNDFESNPNESADLQAIRGTFSDGREWKGRDRTGKDKDKVKPLVEPAEKTGRPDHRSDVRFVFDAWIKSTSRTIRTLLDDKRRALIVRQLAAYPVVDLVDAVQGWQWSPHNRGENDTGETWNDLALLLRDPAHIERFRDLQRAPHKPTPTAPTAAVTLRVHDHLQGIDPATITFDPASKRGAFGGIRSVPPPPERRVEQRRADDAWLDDPLTLEEHTP